MNPTILCKYPCLRQFSWLALSLSLVACQPDQGDLTAFTASVSHTPGVAIEPVAALATVPAFVYSASHLRSPFVTTSNPKTSPITALQSQCQQPNPVRNKHPLEQFGIDALTFRGFFASKGKAWAIVSAPNRTLHKVTVGDYMGLFFGKIEHISRTAIVLTQLLPDGTGCWQEQQTQLPVLTSAGRTGDR